MSTLRFSVIRAGWAPGLQGGSPARKTFWDSPVGAAHVYRWLAVIALFLLALLIAPRVCGARATEDESPVVHVVRLENEAITPGTARFLHRAIEQAQRDGAACLIVVLDTPGGLVDSTRAIVRDILASKVCIVVYVAPSSARAASAGVFITLSGHVAAMAPGTTIGAAHPVQLGGLPVSPPSPSQPQQDEKGQQAEKPPTHPSEEKVVNDTAAWARALAALRGRNEDWAERAVRESVSITDAVALKEGVVDLVANDLSDLLAKLDGREVPMAHETIRLQTGGAVIREIEMWWGERLLSALSSPNVAFLLLIFGFYGILFELYSPGWGVAGTMGVVCLVLAFFGLAVLPINYVGLVLIALALALFTAEVFVTSYGALSAAGVACLVLGGVMLVDSPVGFLRVSLGVVVPVAAATAVITLVLIGSIVRAHRRGVQSGPESLIGTVAVAQEAFDGSDHQYRGLVRAHGELWLAVCDTPVEAGVALQVQERQRLTLKVKRARTEAPASHGSA